MPQKIKAFSISEVIASAKANAEAREKLSPEERAEQDRKVAELLKQFGTERPTILSVTKKKCNVPKS